MNGKRVSFERSYVVDGEKMYSRAVYVPDIDISGEQNGFFAMAFDITDRKKGELLQAESEDRLRTITDNLPVLISYVDRAERYEFGNATYKTWFGVSPYEMLGKTGAEVMGSDFYSLRRDQVKLALSGKTVRFEMDGCINGEIKTLDTVFIPHVKDGSVQGLYTLTTDITSLKLVEKQLHQLARLDSLTELPNRRKFEETLHEAALRCRRSRQPIVLMFLDLDRFKQINDTYGHAGGDEVLKEFAYRLKTSVRATDTVSRLAGDEFTIILEGVGLPEEAILVAEKILAATAFPLQVGGQSLKISTSIGIASLHGEAINIDRLCQKAD